MKNGKCFKPLVLGLSIILCLMFVVLWSVKFTIAQETFDEEQPAFQEEEAEEISPQGFEEFDTEEPGAVEESEVEEPEVGVPSFPTYPEGFKGIPSFSAKGMGHSLFGGSLWYSALMIVFYAYFAICLQFLAKKTNTFNAWFAWIPIANIFLMLNIAQKPLWWIILFLIPLVNIVIAIIAWMAISKRVGKPAWYGILLIVPIVGIFIPAYLAFSK